MKRLLVSAALLAAISAVATPPLTLAGRWRLALDRGDVGIAERWFERTLPDRIILPGSLPATGIGDDISTNTVWTGGIVDRSWFTAPEYAKYRQPDNVKVPFWLQPEKHYAGVAWYQRDVEIPKEWEGKRVVLFLERPHWETRLWVDHRLVGTNNSLATPHEYDLGQLASGKHTLTLRVDNRMVIDVGENSHCVSDHTQGNWNGIVGQLGLRATPLVWIEDAQVYPAPERQKIIVRLRIGNASGENVHCRLWERYAPQSVWTRPPKNLIANGQQQVEVPAQGVELTVTNDLGSDIELWDEFKPAFFSLRVNLSPPLKSADDRLDPQKHSGHAVSLDFGLRHLSTAGTQFLLNRRKTFFRGTLECCIFPKTGHPPTDIDEWRRIIRVAKSHGLNLIRFHSWCPPEAAFIAADELGIYFHVETCWPNQSTTLGDGKPVDQWVYDETDRILKAYGNHPSFLLMAAGNEPGGPSHRAFLANYVKHYQVVDPRRLWTSCASWPQLPENQFHVTPDPRIQAWGGGLKSRINARPPETATDYRDYIAARKVPVISHEIGQWCVYPNFDEIKKYTGHLKPKNFEIFRDTLEAHQLGDLARQFLIASGKLQALCYKEEIESALRTPGMGGFELLDLHDFPGQGTALVGVLDPFWEEKGYITAKEFSRFCNSTVPLARLPKRVFTTDEKLQAEIEVAHFGPAPLQDTATRWKLVDDTGKALASGELSAKTIPLDNNIALGSVTAEFENVSAPAHCKLVVGIKGTVFENDWDIWVYPPALDTSVPAGITVANELNDAALANLNSGGRVLLLIPPQRVVPDKKRGKVAPGFSSIFWNTAWTQNQPPHTLGILCDPKHPIFAEFPTDFHSNWQWWYLISRAGAMILDDFPSALQPTVQVIDDWFTARKLGLVVEAKLDAGKLVICSVDLENDLASDPVRRQFRHSLLRYMASDRFAPKHAVTADQVRGLIVPPSN